MTSTDPDAYKAHVLSRKPANTFLQYPILTDQISRQGLQVVWDRLGHVLQQKTPGHIVEFGCYAGTTSLFVRRQLDHHNQSGQREFHVYDSFEGLPDKQREDESAAGIDFTKGKLMVSKHQFVTNFRAASLQPPIIHKGWFSGLTVNDIPHQIAFAFLDGDFFSSIHTSLALVWPRICQGGVVLIDDYQRESLPGVTRAVQTFFQEKPMPSVQVSHNIAVIVKR